MHALAESSGKTADGRPPDPVASSATSAARTDLFGAQLSAPFAAVASFQLDGSTASAGRADVAPRASALAAGPAPSTPPIREIDVDLSPGGLEDVSMTMRLAGDKLSVVIRAASSQTLNSIEGARDAIADRMAAIGQPLDSLIVKQTGVNTDGNANGNGSSADGGSAEGTAIGARRRRTGRFERCAFLGAALVAIAVSSGAARADGSLACEREMTRASAQHGVPLNVLYSVGLTETGSRNGLSPYDMNVDGQAVHSTSLAEAMARFAQAKGRGAKFIDIGCMQINHHFHSADFHSLERDVRPGAQCRICRELPQILKAQEGTWTLAVARYNAGPGNPAAEKTYVCSVIRNMVASGFGQWTANARALCQ